MGAEAGLATGGSFGSALLMTKIAFEAVPVIFAKTILTKVKDGSQWFGVDYNMNIYRGCSHGCIYCDSRSSCYRNDDFDRVKVKENALAVIRENLRSRRRSPGVIATGAMSDPYNPLERELRLTRGALELIASAGFGVAIDTKGDLVVRDADVLRQIGRNSPAVVKITITTADEDLCAKIEPNAPSSRSRFAALRCLSRAGVYCGVLMMPLLPLVNDTPENVLAVLRAAADAGARFVYPGFGLSMRDGQREYLHEKLDDISPGLGVRYARVFGDRYRCPSPRARELSAIFASECERLGLLYRMPDIVAGYRKGYGGRQSTLFQMEDDGHIA